MLGSDRVENDGYRMGPNGIERNWMGEDGTGRDVTGVGENGFPSFSELINKQFLRVSTQKLY